MRMAELLIARGAKIEARTSLGETPLHTATQRGQTALATLLLAKGADINVRTTVRYTPLGLAVDNRHSETAELLRQHGAIEQPVAQR